MTATTLTQHSAVRRDETAAGNGAKRRTRIIDCDVHHQFLEPEVLFPYLPRHYIEYIKDFGTMMPGVGYTNMPGSGARHDLWDGKDINPSTEPEVAIQKHLDAYDLDIAILTGGPYAAAAHPDADYAAAYCRAFNMWTEEQWVAKDSAFPRLNSYRATRSGTGGSRDRTTRPQSGLCPGIDACRRPAAVWQPFLSSNICGV